MQNCKLNSLRGFAYKLHNSIINCSHYQEGSIIMPIANSIQLFDGKRAQIMFSAKREISAIDMRDNLLLIGEKASPGQLISAILLDMDNLQKPLIFNYQKTQLNFVSISLGGDFICSVGSSSNQTEELNLIEVNNQSEIGTRVYFNKVYQKKKGKVMSVRFSNLDPNFFVVMRTSSIIFYRIDRETQTVEGTTAKTSKVRIYNNFIFSPDGHFLYGCSQNGDIAQISISEGRETRIGPRRRVITKGINNIRYVEPGLLVISGKEGLLAIIQVKEMKLIKELRLHDQEVVSFTQFADNQAYIATNKAAIYKFDLKSCQTQLIYNCHFTKINELALIKDFDGIFGTCSGSQIIIWRTKTLTPIIKIQLPKLTCLSISFPKTGRMIISAWSDDAIRFFSAQSGKMTFKIPIANLGGAKVIITDDDSSKMLAGGMNGVIRVWNIFQDKKFGLVIGALAYHMRPVHGLALNPTNADMLVSCSDDGQFAVWNLDRFELLKHFFVANFLNGVQFVDQKTIRTWGCGNIIFTCLISDGKILKKQEINGTYINSVSTCQLDMTTEKLLFYGGDEHYLDYYEMTESSKQIYRVPSLGQIAKTLITSDKEHIVAVTQNGIILVYDIYGVRNKQVEQSY